ncbi:MAG: phage holin family protein [Gammaproteobacteria bacterium]
MIPFITHLVVTAALLLIVANLVEGIKVEGWGAALLGALILGVANAVVKPLMVFLTLPLTLVTFGLFLLVVNGVTLQIAGALTPGIHIKGCGSAILGSLVLSLLNVAISLAFPPIWPVI